MAENIKMCGLCDVEMNRIVFNDSGGRYCNTRREEKIAVHPNVTYINHENIGLYGCPKCGIVLMDVDNKDNK